MKEVISDVTESAINAHLKVSIVVLALFVAPCAVKTVGAMLIYLGEVARKDMG